LIHIEYVERCFLLFFICNVLARILQNYHCFDIYFRYILLNAIQCQVIFLFYIFIFTQSFYNNFYYVLYMNPGILKKPYSFRTYTFLHVRFLIRPKLPQFFCNIKENAIINFLYLKKMILTIMCYHNQLDKDKIIPSSCILYDNATIYLW